MISVAVERRLEARNHLLGALPGVDYRRIQSKLERVSFKLGETLYEPDTRIEYAFFPTTAVISLLYVMEDGSTAAVSVVGNDGMVGVAMFMGAETASNEAIVQCAGDALRMKYSDLHREFKRGGAFQSLMLRFAMALLEQTSQIAVCNRLHSVEMQLCRWILFTHDRLDSDNLEITHGLISNILGVSREGITLATKKLKEKGLIENNRGSFVIIDRRGMEAVVCECYRRVTKEYNRLLGRGISRTFG